MRNDHVDLALAAGHSWAELKAEALRGTLAASEWPDAWDDRENPSIPFSKHELTATDWIALSSLASRAAHERWLELVIEQRSIESFDGDADDDEVAASHLEDSLRAGLPAHFLVTRDGPLLYLQNTFTGEEEPVESMRQAWRVVSEWQEHLVDHYARLQ